MALDVVFVNPGNAGEILKFRDECFYNYLSNPNFRNLIERKFGIKAVVSVNKSLEYRMTRKLY